MKGDGSQACENTTFLAPRFWSHPGWYVRKGCRCDYTYGIARVGGAEPDQKKDRGLGLTTSSELTVALGLTKNWL